MLAPCVPEVLSARAGVDICTHPYIKEDERLLQPASLKRICTDGEYPCKTPGSQNRYIYRGKHISQVMIVCQYPRNCNKHRYDQQPPLFREQQKQRQEQSKKMSRMSRRKRVAVGKKIRGICPRLKKGIGTCSQEHVFQHTRTQPADNMRTRDKEKKIGACKLPVLKI